MKMMNMGFGQIGMILFWVAALAALIFLIRFFLSLDRSKHDKSSSLETLNGRYASGEISQEQYEQIKRDITAL